MTTKSGKKKNNFYIKYKLIISKSVVYQLGLSRVYPLPKTIGLGNFW